MKPAIGISLLFASVLYLQLTSARPLYIYHVNQSHGREISSPSTNNNHGRDVPTYHDNQNHGRDIPESAWFRPRESDLEDLHDPFSKIVGHFLNVDPADSVVNGMSDLLGHA